MSHQKTRKYAVGHACVDTSQDATMEWSPALRSGLAELLRGAEYAQRAERSAWDFAVEIAILRAHGLTETDLRWLLCMGYAEHAREITRLDEDGRQFRPLGSLSFARRTCLVLTHRGIGVARDLTRSRPEFPDRTKVPRAPPRPSGGNGNGHPTSQAELPHFFGKTNGHRRGAVPTWDKERRELRVNEKLVKHFRWPAVNQETILAAFDEEGWPPRIDDPLPPLPEQDSKRRLHDTIKCMNKNQHQNLIQFHGDGTGEGVTWELIADDPLEEQTR